MYRKIRKRWKAFSSLLLTTKAKYKEVQAYTFFLYLSSFLFCTWMRNEKIKELIPECRGYVYRVTDVVCLRNGQLGHFFFVFMCILSSGGTVDRSAIKAFVAKVSEGVPVTIIFLSTTEIIDILQVFNKFDVRKNSVLRLDFSSCRPLFGSLSLLSISCTT